MMTLARTTILYAGIVLVAGMPVPLHAADPAPAAQIASLQQAVQQGSAIFAQDHFGGAGTCDTCHGNGGQTAGKLPDGSKLPSLVGAAAEFPRYSARSHSVITLSQQINRCITGALQGTPPAPGSPELVYLETYITSLSKGAVIGKQFE